MSNLISNVTVDTWCDYQIEVEHTPNKFEGFDHIEVRTILPKSAPLPITETGYRSSFPPSVDVRVRGGAMQYVLDWLNEAQASDEWQRYVHQANQRTLF